MLWRQIDKLRLKRKYFYIMNKKRGMTNHGYLRFKKAGVKRVSEVKKKALEMLKTTNNLNEIYEKLEGKVKWSTLAAWRFIENRKKLNLNKNK